VPERLEFKILGPLEVVVGERRLALTSLSQRTLLALLLLRADQVMGIERLIDDLWAESPPRRAEVAVRMAVSRLRRLFGAEGSEVLLTRPRGYLLRVDPERVDARRFERLVGEGQVALAAGRMEEAAGLLREALGLWRGPVLGELASMHLVMAEAARLEGVRLAAVLARVEADEGLGRHAEALAELQELAGSYPLDEGLHGRLMRALARAGRQVEALEAFRDLRRRLVEEQGVEPTPDLQRLERAILAGDPSLQRELGPPARSAAEAGVVPAELPPDTASFTGRRDELARLERVVAAGGGSGPVVISALDGGGGVGKSALAVHAAHRLAERFPDGQLYVNLQGSTPGLAPLRPLEALGRMLRSLGVDPAQVPTEVEDAAALFRSELADRRLLMVLDNARDTAQVTPLLPGVPGCGVLVTSRRALTGLERVTHLHLDVLAPEEAITLLGRVAGAERIAAEPAAAAAVARWCGHLPLALRIAGARLAARPAWPVRVMAERLEDEQRRLDELELAEVEVRASLAVSHRLLRESPAEIDRLAAEAFGLLGILDGPELGVQVAARLLDRPEPAVESLLERLVDAQLLETPSAGRYRLHDLLRLYARELAVREHAEPVRAAILSRALGFYVGTAWRCFALLRPGDRRLERADARWAGSGLDFADAISALDWLEAERPNLLAAVRQAAATAGLPSRSRRSSPTPCSRSSTSAAPGTTASRPTTSRWRWRDGPATGPPRPRPSTTSASSTSTRAPTSRPSPATRRAWPSTRSWATATARPAPSPTSAIPMRRRVTTSSRSPAASGAWPPSRSWATATARASASPTSASSTNAWAATSRRWTTTRRAWRSTWSWATATARPSTTATWASSTGTRSVTTRPLATCGRA
jgi:DNA-binding SARP family transcriptional activator